MNFQIEKDKLVKILSKIASLYTDQADIEILECLYLEAVNNNLIIKSTNLMCKMICNLTAEIKEEGRTIVNFKSLYGIVKNLPNAKLSFYIENNQLVIKTNNKKFGISTYPVDNFPEINDEQAEKINLDTNVLIKTLGKFDKIFGKDFPQNHLCFISRENFIELVATNGKRLVYCKTKNETGKDFKILIDDKSLSILKGFIKEKEKFDFEFGSKEFIVYNNEAKLIITYHTDFKFPGYEFLLDIPHPNEILIKKSELEESLKLLMANLKDDKLVTINIKDKEFSINFKSTNLECDQTIELDDGAVKVGLKLNSEYLLDAIRHMSEDKIKIKYNDRNTPLRLESENYIGFLTLCN